MATPTTLADTIGTTVPFLNSLGTAVAVRVPPDAAMAVEMALKGVKDGITALAASEKASQSKPIVERIASDAQAILSVAAGLPLPPPFNIILIAVSGLLPTVISVARTLLDHRTTVVPASPP